MSLATLDLFLVARFVAEVGSTIPAGVPDTFDGIDFVKAAVCGRFETNVVENEELGFRSDISRVAEAGAVQVGFALLCNVAGITGATTPGVIGSTMLAD